MNVHFSVSSLQPIGLNSEICSNIYLSMASIVAELFIADITRNIHFVRITYNSQEMQQE